MDKQALIDNRKDFGLVGFRAPTMDENKYFRDELIKQVNHTWRGWVLLVVSLLGFRIGTYMDTGMMHVFICVIALVGIGTATTMIRIDNLRVDNMKRCHYRVLNCTVFDVYKASAFGNFTHYHAKIRDDEGNISNETFIIPYKLGHKMHTNEYEAKIYLVKLDSGKYYILDRE